MDNRALMYVEKTHRPLPVQLFCHEHFYGDDLMLENVSDEPLLGFRIDELQRTITARIPEHSSQFRSRASANAIRFALSGFRARALLIARFTRPRRLIVPQLQDLTSQYLRFGLQLSDLRPTLTQLLRQFHCLRPWIGVHHHLELQEPLIR